jgi:CheY-like chemotaxis protein
MKPGMEKKRSENQACLPDIIFMDIRLPGENGWFLLKKSKKSTRMLMLPFLPATTSLNIRRLPAKMAQSSSF